jgi:hypothetical protein
MAAIREFQAREDRQVDLKELRSGIDALESEFCASARDAQKAGEHLVSGNITAASWIARTCNMSVNSAADRLCHVARHVADPDGFFNEAEESYLRRGLHISQMSDGMYRVDGVLDPVTGASVKTASETLAKRQGPEDDRSHSQRMHDAWGEIVNHALGQGTLPRRHGVKPHINLTTTIEGVKNEVGAPPAELELSLPISTRTLERIACDCTMSRVLLADSTVIDVGRATRVVSAPTMRALRVRDKGCRFPGCDRQVDWSSPHHIIHWARGGPGNLPNLVLLCHYHHRLVHEGGWQVIKSGREFRFLPPERVVMRRVRGPGMRWAA